MLVKLTLTWAKKHSLERCRANSLAQQGNKNPNFGKPMSSEQKEKISATLKGKYTGENNFNAKLNLQIANQIREDYKSLPSSRKLAKNYGVSPSTILLILRNKIWINDA